MAMTFDGQRSSSKSKKECGTRCAKEEVSSSLLGKLALPRLCYKHIPSISTYIFQAIRMDNIHIYVCMYDMYV